MDYEKYKSRSEAVIRESTLKKLKNRNYLASLIHAGSEHPD